MRKIFYDDIKLSCVALYSVFRLCYVNVSQVLEYTKCKPKFKETDKIKKINKKRHGAKRDKSGVCEFASIAS